MLHVHEEPRTEMEVAIANKRAIIKNNRGVGRGRIRSASQEPNSDGSVSIRGESQDRTP
jgi:hypothetical protein